MCIHKKLMCTQNIIQLISHIFLQMLATSGHSLWVLAKYETIMPPSPTATLISICHYLISILHYTFCLCTHTLLQMVSNVRYPLPNVGMCTHKRLCTHKLSTTRNWCACTSPCSKTCTKNSPGQLVDDIIWGINCSQYKYKWSFSFYVPLCEWSITLDGLCVNVLVCKSKEYLLILRHRE